MAQRGLLRLAQVFENGPGGRNEVLVAIADAESLQRRGAEVLEQPLLRLVGIEVPARPLRDDRPGQPADIVREPAGLDFEQLAATVGQQALGGREPLQLVEQLLLRTRWTKKCPVEISTQLSAA